MARLPQPGSDRGTWGDVLNDFLASSHNTDGTLKSNTVGAAQLQTGFLMTTTTNAGVTTRPTSRTDITVLFVGPGADPAIVIPPAVNGMYNGDIRIVTG
jgi:hypothetical protein